jgi:hypothetical protein
VKRRAALVAYAAALLVACGGGERAAVAPRPPDASAPRWEDAFDGVPDVLVVVHPRAIARDSVYGALLKSLSRAIAARAPQTAAMGGARAAEAFESSEEVILGASTTPSPRGEDDALVVLRGVRADIDPVKMVDDRGAPMWRAAAMVGSVEEFTREGGAGTRPASLFVLPQRTWVVAVGGARERARDAFVRPARRPAPVKDDGALVLVRLEGRALVAAVPRLRARGAPLEPIGRKLEAVSLALRGGKGGLEARLQYGDETAAAFAESAMKDLVQAIARAREGTAKLKWLGQARVDREASTVTGRVELPLGLLEALPEVTPSELGL